MEIRLSSAKGRWIILTTVLGSSMALLDGTVVNVALPHIGDDLHANLSALQWTVNAYTLTLAALILLGGSLGDRYGRRRIFVVGVVWFGIGSLLCGIAPDADLLILARALQGIGGALLVPGSLAIIQGSFHPDDRARAVGVWSGLGGVGAAVGPFLGGYLVDGPGWRWVFLINLPLAAICVPVALRHAPESKDPAHHGRFDVTGAVLGAGALALVTYALIAKEPWSGIGGVLVAVGFVLYEHRRADPMLPLSIFRSRLFTSVNLVTLCVYAAFGGFFFLASLQLQVVVGYSALGAGAALLPTTALMLLFSARSGELAGRIGPRIPLTVGPLLCAGGLLLMLRVGPGASYLADILAGAVGAGPGDGDDRRAADGDRAGVGGGGARGTGERDQQRGGPRGGSARGGGAAADRGDEPGGVPVGDRVQPHVPYVDAAVRGDSGGGLGDRVPDRTDPEGGGGRGDVPWPRAARVQDSLRVVVAAAGAGTGAGAGVDRPAADGGPGGGS